MKDSKLLALIQGFEKEDFRAFSDFIRSPYFNKREELVVLYEYLKKCAPNFSSKKITREQVFAVVNQEDVFDNKLMNHQMNYLAKLVETYLGLRHYENATNQQELDILEELVDRKLDKHYEFLKVKTKNKIEEKAIRDSDFYHECFQYATIANQQFLKTDVRRYDAYLEQATDYLDSYYLLEKLRMSCETLERQRMFQQKRAFRFEAQIEEMCQIADLSTMPVVEQYFLIYCLLTKPNKEETYQKLKSLFLASVKVTPIADQQKILIFGINFCANQVRFSDNRDYYMEEALNLYIYGVNDQILFNNGILSPWHFKNVIKLSINLKKYTWVENFIRQNTKFLEEQFRENALHFNLSDLFYHKKDYENALSHLNQVEFSDVFYALSSRELLMRIYYESDEEEALFAQIASFTIYLKRNRNLSADVRKTYLNFCKILGQILRRNPKKFAAIGQTIQGTKLLSAKNWLLKIYEKELEGMR